jgi:hypothetical protein
MKTLLFLFLTLPLLCFAEEKVDYNHQFCTTADGVYRYKTPQSSVVFDCVNKEFVYKFTTASTYVTDAKIVKEQVVVLKKKPALVINISEMPVTAKTDLELNRLRTEVSTQGMGVLFFRVKNEKLHWY